MVLAASVAFAIRGRLPRQGTALAATLTLLCTAATIPVAVERIVTDLRVTTRMGAYNASVAGPVQAYLQPYLLDRVEQLLPKGASYVAIAGPGVTEPTARLAFPGLALDTLFPRLSVADPRTADWIVAWGANPRAFAPVSKVIVARRAEGSIPAVLVAKVLH